MGRVYETADEGRPPLIVVSFHRLDCSSCSCPRGVCDERRSPDVAASETLSE